MWKKSFLLSEVISIMSNIRNSHPEVFRETYALKKFPKFIGKHLCWNLHFNKVKKETTCNFVNKETPIWAFFCEFSVMLQNAYYKEHLRIAATVTGSHRKC